MTLVNKQKSEGKICSKNIKETIRKWLLSKGSNNLISIIYNYKLVPPACLKIFG
jgi:hypothetical protein